MHSHVWGHGATGKYLKSKTSENDSEHVLGEHILYNLQR